MKDHAQTTDCRRWTLLNHFGEPTAGVCGHCDSCRTGQAKRVRARGQRADEGHPFPLRSRVRSVKYGIGIVMEYRADKVTVLFDEAGPNDLVTAYGVGHALPTAAV